MYTYQGNFHFCVRSKILLIVPHKIAADRLFKVELMLHFERAICVIVILQERESGTSGRMG